MTTQTIFAAHMLEKYILSSVSIVVYVDGTENGRIFTVP